MLTPASEEGDITSAQARYEGSDTSILLSHSPSCLIWPSPLPRPQQLHVGRDRTGFIIPPFIPGETEARPHLETCSLLAARQWQCPVTTALSLPLVVSRLERSQCNGNTHRQTPPLGQGHQLGGGGGGCCFPRTKETRGPGTVGLVPFSG